MQSWEQIDLPAKVETVKRRTRPWKSIIALAFAIAAAIVSYQARYHKGFFHTAHDDFTTQLIGVGTAVAFCIFASIATVSLAAKARELTEPRTGVSHAAILRYAILIVGGFTTLVMTLELFGVPIGQLVLGGALTSVFVGIAAQQALSNVFAGLVLLFARPFRVGDAIRLRAGALGGQLDGIVTDIGITYVRLDTGGSIMSVPNSQVLNAVVGPIPPSTAETPPSQHPPTATPAPITPITTPPAPAPAATAPAPAAPAAPGPMPASDTASPAADGATSRSGTATAPLDDSTAATDDGSAVNPGGPGKQGARPPGP